MKRKGCLVFIKIGSILLITKGGGVPLVRTSLLSTLSPRWLRPLTPRAHFSTHFCALEYTFLRVFSVKLIFSNKIYWGI